MCGVAHTSIAHGSAHNLHTDCSCQQTHVAQGVTGCRGLSTDQGFPVLNVLPPKAFSHPAEPQPPLPLPRTLRVALHSACPRMPSLQPSLGVHTQVQALLCFPGHQPHLTGVFSFTLHFQLGMAVLNSIWGMAGGVGEGATSTFSTGKAGEPPQPQHRLPTARGLPPAVAGRMPRAGPLCRGFGFQGGPPAHISAFPGASCSQPGQSPPALIPPCGHLPTDKGSLLTLESEGSCGIVGSLKPPTLTATGFTPADPGFPELEVRSSPSLQRT